MGLMDWLSGRAERANVSFSRSYLNKIRREVADDPSLLERIATWVAQDEVLLAVTEQTMFLHPLERKERLMEAAHKMMTMGQRLEKDMGDSQGISATAGKTAILLSHVLFLKAAEASDDQATSREASLALEDYEQFFNRMEPYLPKPQAPEPPRQPVEEKQEQKWKPQVPPIDPLEEVRRRINRLGDHLK